MQTRLENPQLAKRLLGNLAMAVIVLQIVGLIGAAQQQQANSSSVRDMRYEIHVSGIT